MGLPGKYVIATSWKVSLTSPILFRGVKVEDKCALHVAC